MCINLLSVSEFSFLDLNVTIYRKATQTKNITTRTHMKTCTHI